MALIYKYTLLCDEVRQENNGKFMILGVYTPDIIVPAVPFALPSLSFFNVLESDEAGTFEFTLRLSVGGNQLVTAGGQVGMAAAGVVALPLRFGPVHLQVDGEYVFVFESPALDEPAEFRFRVVVRPPGGDVRPVVLH